MNPASSANVEAGALSDAPPIASAPLAPSSSVPPPDRPATDRHTPLCEGCGYSIGSLASERVELACPECGRSIATSLPAHRKGSPWQQRRGVRSWLRTNYQTLRHPSSLFASLRIEPRSGTGLLLINCAVAAAMLVDPWVGVIAGDPARSGRGTPWLERWSIHGLMWVLEVAAGALVLLALTCIEWLGVRSIARMRGWRLTPEGAWQVVCHASVGWIVMGVLPTWVMALAFALLANFGIAPSGSTDFGRFVPGMRPIANYWLIHGGLVALAALAGLVTFELLVYIGVRRCKFAATRSPG